MGAKGTGDSGAKRAVDAGVRAGAPLRAPPAKEPAIKALRFQTVAAGRDAAPNAAPSVDGQGDSIDVEGAEDAEGGSRSAREGKEKARDADRARPPARYGHVLANLEGWPRVTCDEAASDVLAHDGRGVPEDVNEQRVGIQDYGFAPIPIWSTASLSTHD